MYMLVVRPVDLYWYVVPCTNMVFVFEQHSLFRMPHGRKRKNVGSIGALLLHFCDSHTTKVNQALDWNMEVLREKITNVALATFFL